MLASDLTYYPFFSVLAFIAFILCVIPLSWHFQAWNSGTCAFMIWTGLACLVTGINSIVWANTFVNLAPVWCDISSQIILGSSIGIPASTLCISRRLYHITSSRSVSITRNYRLRGIYVDLAFSLGIPILFLVLHIIIQPHRFDILEEYGCASVTYNVLPAYFLDYSWPIAISLVSLLYLSLVLRTFYMRRIQFNQILSSNATIKPSRYLRLMLLALINSVCTIPICIYTIYIRSYGLSLTPWVSWKATHHDFALVQLIPAVIWRSDPVTYASVQITRWLPVIYAFIFFGLFGFAEEAMTKYRRAFRFFFRLYPASQGDFSGTKGKRGLLSGLKDLMTNDKDLLPVYMTPAGPTIPSAHYNIRKSILDADSRSTICFPDDEAELSSHRECFPRVISSNTISPSSSSTSTCLPLNLALLDFAPPTPVHATFLEAASSALGEKESNSRLPPPTAESFMILSVEELADSSRPSSYFSPSLQEQHFSEDDRISISEAYFDSCGTSPVHDAFVHVPTPVPFIASELPMFPPRALSLHRPFSAPSIYPVAQPHSSSRDMNVNDGIIVMVHTQIQGP